MTRSDIRPILPSPKTVLEALATPDALIPHRRPELITGLQELCALHRAYRAAATDLATAGLPEQTLRAASESIAQLATGVEYTVLEIDEEIARRLDAYAEPSADAPMHTESVGAVLSRITMLWVEVDAHRDGTDDLPEAVELFELLGAYAALREDISSGRRQLPTPRRPRH